ncbi:MAG: sensor domain-containing diguanylate cyclase [Vicinamibacteria bacterium]
MKATRPDSWRLVKSERLARRGSVVPIRKQADTPDIDDGRAQTAGRTSERRLALFYSNPEVRDSFQSLSSEGIEIDTFEIARFALGTGKDRRRVDKPHGSWKKGQRFEAIIVEQSSPSRSYDKLVRWLRKAVPETPILAYASPPLAAKEQPGVSLHLTELPTVESLPSILSDAQRHHRLNRKSALLARRLRETSRRLQVLGDIVATANSVLEPERVVAVIMSHIQRLIPSEAWSLLLVDEKKKELTFEMALGEKGDDFSDIRLKIGEGIAGWVAETGKPAIVNDVASDPRFQGRYDEQNQFQTRSILCAPLVSRGATIGVVEILNRASGSRFTKRDLDLLLTLVEPAAIALENALLFQRAEKLAITDGLTKLYNSHYLNTCLGREIERASRERTSFAVIFLDLDGFKGVNDQHGHLCGSRTLFEVGSILRQAVREEDVVSRYGGDEFVVVLPNIDGQGAFSIARRIRKGLKEHAFLGEFGLAVHLSASFGISSFPEHGRTPQDLIQKADQAMYSVKERGKDAVAVAGSPTEP